MKSNGLSDMEDIGADAVKRVTSEMTKMVWNVFVEGNDAATKWRNVNDIIARMELAWQCRYRFKRTRYYHTGIEPKRHNRSRKKQRLTRLQRRWKRQKR
jgi:hypothetical protein